MPKVQIYTDGSCKRNPGPGGWAFLLISDGIKKQASGGEANTTNNRMEMRAVLEAAKTLHDLPAGIVEIHSDSRLVINTLSKGWKRKQNLDLWEQIDEELAKLNGAGWQLSWHWVKGHAGHKENELVDDLAQAAAGLVDNAGGDPVGVPAAGASAQMALGIETDDADLRNLLAENIFECGKCGANTAGVLSRKSDSGPIRVDCEKCGKYIKFARQV